MAGEVRNGELPLGAIAARVNVERSEREEVTHKRISNTVTSLSGWKVRKGHANRAMLVWDQTKIDKLVTHYATPADQGVQTHTGTSADKANLANDVTPMPGDLSLVSVDSDPAANPGVDNEDDSEMTFDEAVQLELPTTDLLSPQEGTDGHDDEPVRATSPSTAEPGLELESDDWEAF